MSAVLELRGISKQFGTVAALREASIVVHPRSIVALVGENGAGKTTLMRVAFGLVRPDAGQVLIDGREARLTTPAQAMESGIGMVHQHFALVPALTAAENSSLGRTGWFSARRAAARLERAAAASGLSVDPSARVDELPTGAQQRLEIATALARGARLLILDEPTAVLTPQESTELLHFVRRFADEGGAVVLITHKLREALGVADAVTVMRRGRTVLDVPRAAATEESVARAMLGDAPDPSSQRELVGTPVPHAVPPDSPPVATARHLIVAGTRGTPTVRGASFTLRSGEIVGIAGVEGSGVHELVRALAGRIEPSGGSLELPRQIGFVPEDRLRDALVPEWTIIENVALRDAGTARGRLPWGSIERETAELLTQFGVAAGGPRTVVATLSGGSQQRLVLARELAGKPSLLVVEQPTRGLDIAATAAIHERLRAARDGGAAVVVVSADLDELIMLADRLLVMYEGRPTEVVREREALGRAMLGLE